MPPSLLTRINRAIAELPEEIRPSGQECQAQLVAAGVDSVVGLRRLLRDPTADPELLTSAAWLVGLAGVEELAPDLEALVHERTPELVLWEVGKGLIGLDAGRPAFRRLLQEASGDAPRKVAVHVLGALRDDESLSAILAILDSSHEPADLRGEAAEALGYLADPGSLETLLRAAGDPAADVRFWAVFALGELRDERARPLLEEMARSDHAEVEGWWAVSKEARDALARFDSDD